MGTGRPPHQNGSIEPQRLRSRPPARPPTEAGIRRRDAGSDRRGSEPASEKEIATRSGLTGPSRQATRLRLRRTPAAPQARAARPPRPGTVGAEEAPATMAVFTLDSYAQRLTVTEPPLFTYSTQP